MTGRAGDDLRCSRCGAQLLSVQLDTKSVLLVDAMPALRGNVAARVGRSSQGGWRGYRLRPGVPAPPHHVTFSEHHCPSREEP